MKIKHVANVYLVLALVLGALVPVMLKIATQNINIYEYLMLTFLVSLPVSFMFVLFRRKTGRLIGSMRNVKEFAFIAFLGLLNYGMLEYGLAYSEKFISSSLATVVYRISPLLMLIFLPIILKERVSKLQIIALLLGFAGLYIAITGGSITALGGANTAIIGFVALIALSSAFVSVAIKKYSFDMEIAVFIFSLATFVFFAALFFAVKAPFQPVNASALLAILYVGAIYNVFVGLMYYGALRMIKTTLVTNAYFLSPFITFLFSWIMLGERIYFYYIAIAVLVSVGLLMQKFDRKGGTYLSKGTASNRTIHDVTSAFVNTDAPSIYNIIRSGGRVLAIKIDRESKKAIGTVKRQLNEERRNTLIYFNSEKSLINKEQDLFIKEIMGVKQDEVVLMSAGDPSAGEEALSAIAAQIP
ncbi:MAG: EamA family transporter [Candidatus Micrarchaeota archaeon]|nr:EamA family transporter [Candidatus Micrarchaeota archaeon]